MAEEGGPRGETEVSPASSEAPMPTRVLDQQFLDSQVAEVLRRKNIITDQDVMAWRQGGSQHETLENIVLGKHTYTEEDWARLKGDVWGVPYKNLVGITITEDTLGTITEAASRNYSMVAFERSGNEVSVGLMEPYNLGALEALEFLAKEQSLKIRYYIISPSSFAAAVKQYHPLTEQVETVLGQAEEKFAPAEEEIAPEEVDEAVKRAPIAKIVSVIIQHAVEGKASDIHIEPTAADGRVRYRIDGVLHTSLILPKYVHPAVISRIKVLAKLKLDETRLPQDGRTRIKVGQQEIDLRISILPVADGEKAVIRVLDVSMGPPKLSDLGFRSDIEDLLKRSIKKPHGLLLVTGPTGSGKSTTLFSCLTLINQEGTNIITLEDPIEYFIEGVNQSQVNPEIGYTFAAGLRSILRQDPNVIMVGEVRDRETAELVIHASLTGHYVLSTLHTNDAVGAIPRLIDMGVEPFLLASALDLIVAQRLVRRLCPDCSVADDNPQIALEVAKKELAGIEADIVKKALKEVAIKKRVGCPKCGNTGYRGRLCIAEVIENTEAMEKVVIKGSDIDAVTAELKNQNFITLRQDGMMKVLKGATTIEEVLRATSE